MKLSDILDALASGELHTLNCVDNGVVDASQYPRVIRAINRGLLKLGTRFTLKKAFVELHTQAGQQAYALREDEVGTTLFDTPAYPFKDNRFKEVIRITDKDGELCHTDGSYNLVQTSLTTLYFQTAIQHEVLLVHYSKFLDPVQIQTPLDPETIEVDLPLAYLNALIYYVASTFYAPTLGGLDLQQRANVDVNYLNLYEAECTNLTAQGLDVQEDVTTDVFQHRGFV